MSRQNTPNEQQARRLAGLALVLAVLAAHGWLLDRLGGHGGTGRDQVATVRALQAVRLAVHRPESMPVSMTAPPPMRGPVQSASPAPRAMARSEPSQSSPVDPAIQAPSDPGHGAESAAPPMLAGQIAGADGDEAPAGMVAASVPVQPPPVYPTAVPEPIHLRYALRIGVGSALRSGVAELAWQHDGHGYHLELQGQGQGTLLIRQSSQGTFDAAGLAPERFIDQRRRGSARSANFQREAGRISFSGPRIEYPAWPGAQDRLGWIAQLAAIAQAAGGVSHELSLFVVDARGVGGLWTFNPQGTEPISTEMGSIAAVKLLREPQHLLDWRVEAWLDPQQGFWPVRLRMTLPRTGAVLELSPMAGLAP